MKKQTQRLINSCLLASMSIMLTTPSYAEQATNNNEPVALNDDIAISYLEAKSMVADMSFAQRQKVLSDESKLNILIFEALTLKKMAKKATDEEIDNDPVVQWRLQTAKNNILALALVKKHEDTIKLPSGLEALAKEYYQTHSKEFTIEERINVAHILLRVHKKDSSDKKEKQLTKIKEILKEIEQGLDFSEAAKKYSQDSTANKGGELGFFTRGKMIPAFEKAAFKLTKDKPLSKIVEGLFGFHIIKLIDRIPSSIKPYKNVKADLIAKQGRKYVTAEVHTYKNSFDTFNKSTVLNVPVFDSLIKELKKTD